MTASPFTIKQGDRRPFLRVQLIYSDRTLANLTGASSVTFKMRPAAGGALKINAVGVVIDTARGIVEYQWDADDTDTLGDFDTEWMVTWADGREQTFPSEGFGFVRVTVRL